MFGKTERPLLISSIILVSLFGAMKSHHPWMWPVIDSFPAVERLLDPNFLINDFTTNTFNDFSARYYISNFFAFGALLFDVHYTIFVKWANILQIFCLGIVSYFFFYAFSRNKSVAFVSFYLAGISLFGYMGNIPTTPAWGFVGPALDGNSLALTFVLLSWTMLVHHRINWSVILMIPPMIFHPIVTFHAAIISLVIYFSFFSIKTLKKILVDWKLYLSLIFLLISFLFSYIPFKESLIGFEGLPDKEFIQILAHFRHPWHYLPSQFNTLEWISFGGYIFSFVYMFIRVKKMVRKKIFIYIPIYLGIIMFLGYFFVEIIPIKIVVSIIPYRSLMIFTPIYILLYAYFMVYKFKQGDYLSFIILHIPFTFLLRGPLYRVIPQISEYNSMIIIVCFLLILSIDIFNLKLIHINSKLHKLSKRFNLYKIFLLFFIVIDIYVIVRVNIFNSGPQIPTLDNQKIIYSWLQKNTPSDSIILADHVAVENRKVRLIARRAIVVDYEFPFLEKHYREWYERFTDSYGYDILKTQGYINNSSESHLNRISYKYGINYIIRTKPIVLPKSFKLVEIVKDVDSNNNLVDVYVYQHIKSISKT